MSLKLEPRDIAMGLAVPLIWGMGFVFAKAAIAHFPPILLMALRFTLTAAVLVWFVKIPTDNLVRLFFIAIVAAAIQYSLTFTGLKGLEAGLAAIVVQLEVPFLVLIGALFLKEKPGLQKWLGILVAFVGVAVISGNEKIGADFISILMVISGAFVWAVGQAMIRTLKEIDGLTVTAWIAVFAAPQLFVMSLLFEDNHIAAIENASPVVWGAVAYLGLIMTALGYFFWNSLIRKHEISRVTPFLLLLPVFSVLGGALFLGEQITATKLIGGLVVILGVAFVTIEYKKAKA